MYKEGNDLYHEDEVKLALGQYTEGLTVADYAASEELVLSQELLCRLFVNRSCCYYSMVSKIILMQHCSINLIILDVNVQQVK